MTFEVTLKWQKVLQRKQKMGNLPKKTSTTETVSSIMQVSYRRGK